MAKQPLFNFWKFPMAIALAGMALLLPACSGNIEETTVGEGLETENNPEFETLEEETVTDLGETVIVRGEIKEVLGPDTFLIQDNEVFENQDILVVGVTEINPVENHFVRVRGTVREFTTAQIEEEYKLNLSQDLEVESETYPVIVAQSSEVIQDEVY